MTRTAIGQSIWQSRSKLVVSYLNAGLVSEERVRHTIETLDGIYLVAEKDGCIVGHAFLERLHLQSIRHVAQLTIGVHRGHQEQGIGTQLMQALIAWAEKSVEKIELNVRASNTRAIALYTKMGFHEEGRLKKRIKTGDRYIDDVLMALHIKLSAD